MLKYELGKVEELWKQEQTFALLHDLTNSVRIADLTAFHKEGGQLLQIKKNPSKGSKAQLKRMQMVLDVLNEGKSIPSKDGPVKLVSSSFHFRTKLEDMERALSMADEHEI